MENDDRAETWDAALCGSENENDAAGKLAVAGCDEWTAARLAACHFGTFTGDVVQ